MILQNIAFAQYAPNPKVKVNYKVTRGMMRSFNTTTSILGNTGGACTEGSGLEIRIHSLFKSSTGPIITPAYCNTATNTQWSCEFRTESCANSGSCGVWYNNSSTCLSNPVYSNDPIYTDTSDYPSSDILEIQMKGFETDNFNTILNGDKANFNYNDGACQSSCTNGNCYGNQQIPTTGRYTTIDVGAITNTLAPFCGSNWSSLIDAAYEGPNCALDLTGFQSYYYLQWQYRWCWDASTLFDRHAGLIKKPNTIKYCSGANIIASDSLEGFEVTRGFATYQWEKNSGTGWSNITGATSKDLSTTSLTNLTTSVLTYQIRRATLFCTDFLTIPTKTKVFSNIISVDVYPQPIAPTLFVAGTSPANGTIICKGLFVYAQFNPGTGGYTDASDIYQYSINNGATWLNYTPGNNINTASASTAVLVRVSRTAGSLSSCNATAWSILVNWPLSTIATPPSISSSTPSNITSICLSGISQINGTISEGSGGTGFEYGYSINNSGVPNTIFPGTVPTTNFSINTSGALNKINLFGRRTGVGAGTCSPTPWALIGEWQIVNSPNSSSLNTKLPNTTYVAEGENISISANSGSGGASDAQDEYRVSSDNGVSWKNYVVGSNETVSNGATKMIIQARRNPGTSFGCNFTNWIELASWSVNAVLPVELISFFAYQNELVNEIMWNTVSEFNTKEFIILKSIDFNNWSELGKITAAGNSNKLLYYHFNDHQFANTIVYYKLKIVDNDNSFQYSNIIEVDNRNLKTDKIVLFPNPTNSNIILTTNIGFDKYSAIKITDVLGEINKEITINNNNESKFIVVDCNGLAKGNYYVCIYNTYGILVNTIKFIKY